MSKLDAFALHMLVPIDNVFPGYDGNSPKWLVIHKTAGFTSAVAVANFFATVPDKRSAHYIVGQDGMIVQCVDEANGAGANCCFNAGAAFLPQNINLNLVTISIEHVDPALDNSTPLTPLQQAASFELIQRICIRNAIPMRPGDATGGIIGHMDIDSVNRARCPGNYPWPALWSFLSVNQEDNMAIAPIVRVANPSNGQVQQAADLWKSVSSLGLPPPFNTGIADVWRQCLYNGKPLGPPLTMEYNSVDWSGAAIKRQEFASGHIEWKNGQARVFAGPLGEIVWQG